MNVQHVESPFIEFGSLIWLVCGNELDLDGSVFALMTLCKEAAIINSLVLIN